jgi:hypothetical protein
MEQSDITPVLQGFVFTETEDGLVVENPPILEFDEVGDESVDAEV